MLFSLASSALPDCSNDFACASSALSVCGLILSCIPLHDPKRLEYLCVCETCCLVQCCHNGGEWGASIHTLFVLLADHVALGLISLHESLQHRMATPLYLRSYVCSTCFGNVAMPMDLWWVDGWVGADGRQIVGWVNGLGVPNVSRERRCLQTSPEQLKTTRNKKDKKDK